MKKYIMIIILVGLIPNLTLRFFQTRLRQPTEENRIMKQDSPNQPTVPKDEQIDSLEKSVTVFDHGNILSLYLEEYLLGVVLAEMPVDFEIEALKAQAVVARTFTCKRLTDSKHTEADICTDSSCCQAYMAPNAYVENGGDIASVNKVRDAVEETQNEVLYYNGELIEATYFSCSGGKTENAREVWGNDVPYLLSVISPGEEIAVHYTDTVTMSYESFCGKLGISSNEKITVTRVSYTEGGGISEIQLGEYSYSGTEFRRLLGLRSTAFVISIAGSNVTITTKGYGHRVGMSQYGAEVMALQGSMYSDILNHYFPGTKLQLLFG